MHRYAIGDIHGNFKALKQCLQRSRFNYKKDLLITLGDICDGLPETKQCFDELIKIKKRIDLLGNHDKWLYYWITQNWQQPIWYTQGGYATMASYEFDRKNVPLEHKEVLEQALSYYIDQENRVFVHGGFDIQKHPSKHLVEDLIWDRELFKIAKSKGHNRPDYRLTDFKEIFIGHTTTEDWSLKPVKRCEVWFMDQGAGWSGKLTIMNIDTYEYWQSDLVQDLYPGYKGR